MLLLDGSSLAGVVAPLPLWPRKPTPLDQLQPLETRMSFFSDDDVVVYGDTERRGDVDDRACHMDIGLRWRRIAGGVIVHQNMMIRIVISIK